jgi:hypothetical protein
MLSMYQATQMRRCSQKVVCAPLKIWRRMIFEKHASLGATVKAYRVHVGVVPIQYDLKGMAVAVEMW